MSANVYSLLHLEDSDIDADFVRQRLERTDLPLIIERVANRTDFIDRLQAKIYDVILSDYQVPTMQGLTALDLAQQYQPQTPFLFVSGQMGEELAVESLKRGATDYILKERLIRLPAAIERALAESLERTKHRDAEESLRFAHDAARIGSWELDIASGRMHFSKLCKEYLGLPQDAELTSASLQALIHPEDRDRVDTATRCALETSDNYDIEYRVVWPDGSIRWLNVRGRLIPDKAGRPARMSGVCLDVTERRETEDALRRSESRFRAIVEANPECVMLVARDGTLLQMNHAGLAMIEADSTESAVGACVYNLIAPEDRERFREFNERICRGESGRLEFDIIGLRGTRRHMETHAVPLQDPTGDYLQLAMTRDVTIQKQAEAVLKQSEERFRQLADTMPNLAWMARPDGHIFWYNNRWHEYTGTTLQEMDGWGWQKVHDPAVLPSVINKWNHSLKTGEPFEMVFPLRSKAGDFRPFLTRVQPLRENGKILFWFGTNTNISAQKQAEQQLARMAERERQRADLLDRLATASRTVNSVLSLDSMLRVLAQEACYILGTHAAAVSYCDAEAGGEPMQELAVSEKYLSSGSPTFTPHHDGDGAATAIDPRGFAQSRKQPSALDKLIWLEVPLIGHAGRQLGQLRVADKREGNFTDEDGVVLDQLAAIASIGIENARLYESLRAQDRQKDEFLATLAHELRNPLAPIRNGLTLLRMAPASENLALTEMMDRQLSQLVHLVDDLLDVSRVTTGKIKLKMETIDLHEIVESAIEASRPLINSLKHQIAVTLPRNPLLLNADRTRLAQILTNLLNNAAKYTPPGGKITLTTELQAPNVVIRIADNGVGIPAEMLSRVFDMFQQVTAATERTQDGLGIGLTLVRRLVQMHGGSVVAESAGQGRGSTFTVSLPLASANQVTRTASTTPEAPKPVSDHESSRRILVVDDNVDGAHTLSMTLQLSGHQIIVAHNGPDALNAARDFRPEIVFLDIGLPGMSGYEVARSFRADVQLRDTTLIALTGWGSESDKRQAMDAGFNHHLTKPVEYPVLRQLLAAIMAADGLPKN